MQAIEVPLKERLADLIEKRLLVFEGYKAKDYMGYEGNLKEVRDILTESLRNPETDESAINLFLYSNRFLSGVIDHVLKTKKPFLKYKQLAEKVRIDIFAGNNEEALKALDDIGDLGREELIPVKEETDPISWCAFDPKIISNLVYNSLADKGIDYIVLDGHDAYRPGFMIAAELGIPICAIRNAQDSGRDIKPRPIVEEVEYLSKELKGKNVLIFGEDISTGRAVKSLYDFVRAISKPQSVKTACSIYLPRGLGDECELKPDFYGAERTAF